MSGRDALKAVVGVSGSWKLLSLNQLLCLGNEGGVSGKGSSSNICNFDKGLMGLSMRFSLNTVFLGVLEDIPLSVGSKGSVSERWRPLVLIGFGICFVVDIKRALPSTFGGVGILDGGNIIVDFE